MLDGMGIKCGQIFCRDIVLMIYNMQLRIGGIQPLRQMPPGHKVYLIYPRRILFYRSEPILQIVPVTVAYLLVILAHRLWHILILDRAPLGIISIHPDDHKIDRFLHTVFHHFPLTLQ